VDSGEACQAGRLSNSSDRINGALLSAGRAKMPDKVSVTVRGKAVSNSSFPLADFEG
jgi:hypothetical protein